MRAGRPATHRRRRHHSGDSSSRRPPGEQIRREARQGNAGIRAGERWQRDQLAPHHQETGREAATSNQQAPRRTGRRPGRETSQGLASRRGPAETSAEQRSHLSGDRHTETAQGRPLHPQSSIEIETPSPAPHPDRGGEPKRAAGSCSRFKNTGRPPGRAASASSRRAAARPRRPIHSLHWQQDTRCRQRHEAGLRPTRDDYIAQEPRAERAAKADLQSNNTSTGIDEAAQHERSDSRAKLSEDRSRARQSRTR